MPSVTWTGTTSLVEQKNSGVMTYAERVTYYQEFEGPRETARAFADLHYRGSVWNISYLGNSHSFIVDDCRCEPDDRGRARVKINYTFLNSLPPDEWSVTPFEINPPLERNSYFAALTADELKQARASFMAATAAGQTSIDTAIGTGPNATLIQSLVNKWLNGEETFYMSGLKYQWSIYLFSLSGVTLRRGGYRETPGGPGSYPSMTWLRQADELVWSNGLYKLTRSWIGAPSYAGGWDTDIYGTTPA
jgi:hypothetical protein